MRRLGNLHVVLFLVVGMMWLGCGDQAPLSPDGDLAVESAAKGPPLADAIAAQAKLTPDVLGRPDVVGTAVGLSGRGGPVVFVLVARPGVGGLPASQDGVPVAVKVTGEIQALSALHHRPGHGGGGPGGGGGEDPPAEEPDPTARQARPVPIGVSTGHPDITAGTIGARVTDGTNVYALSNNHVYADENLANVDDPVIQPGTFDGGSSPADDIGNLAAFVPIDFSGAPNRVDAAIALSSPALLGTSTLSDGYGTPRSATIGATFNLKVKKYGRTTGLTSGRVSGLNATVNVGYSTGTALFTGQIIIEPGDFSAGGDSGSLIVVDAKGRDKSDDRRPVGLLFAGSSFVTIANPIGEVLDALEVTIDGE